MSRVMLQQTFLYRILQYPEDGSCESFFNLSNLLNFTSDSVGRLDDVIVHTSGEKTVPGPIEGIISSTHMYKDFVPLYYNVTKL